MLFEGKGGREVFWGIVLGAHGAGSSLPVLRAIAAPHTGHPPQIACPVSGSTVLQPTLKNSSRQLFGPVLAAAKPLRDLQKDLFRLLRIQSEALALRTTLIYSKIRNNCSSCCFQFKGQTSNTVSLLQTSH